MLLNKYVLVITLLLSSTMSYGQVKLSGKITDEETQEPVEFASILLYDNYNKIMEYLDADEEGEFEFKKPLQLGIYKVEVSRLNYNKFIQDIIVGADSDKDVFLEIKLKAKGSLLDEVVLQANNPILVKKDTIIYDIEKLKSQHSETLEDVLSKIAGFEILPNGDIAVNGRLIQKILVDGKEISDFGPTLLTKGLGADKVEEVEVRFDEQDPSIKESLLSDEKFVVMDIRLKSDFNQSIFGVQQAKLGYQDKVKIGGQTNLFSLNKKVNIQMFAELDHFGRNEIDLMSIQNIGDDSFAQMLAIPVTINDFKSESKAYFENLYGFDSYQKNDMSIAGISVNIPINKNTDLFLGSFNDYTFLKQNQYNQLFVDNTLISENNLDQSNKEYNSKNKIQLKHSSKNMKINSDLNFTYLDQDNKSLAESHVINDWFKNHKNKDWYHTTKIEYLITDKLGVSEVFGFSKENYSTYTHLNSSSEYWLNLIDSGKVSQRAENTKTAILNTIQLTYKTKKFGRHYLGYEYEKHSLKNYQLSNLENFESDFSENLTNTHSATYKGEVFVGALFFNYGIKYSNIEYPAALDKHKSKSLFQYDLSSTYNSGEKSYFNLSFSHKLNVFPLDKIINANNIMDFNMIFVPESNLEPNRNISLRTSLYKEYNNRDILRVAYLYGKSNFLNHQTVQDGIIFNHANQLMSDTHSFNPSYNKVFSRWNLASSFAPSFFRYSSEYLADGEINKISSNRYSLHFSVDYEFNDWLEVSYSVSYKHILFKNINENYSKKFNFISNQLSLTSYLFDEKLKIETGFRQVDFLQNRDSFKNLTIKTVYKAEKTRFFLELSNLFDNKNFITQELENSILNLNNNRVFGRFINFGVEMKIN